MSNLFYSYYTSSTDSVSYGEYEYPIAYLNSEFEPTVIDEVLSPAFEKLCNTMSLKEQMAEARFCYTSIPFALNRRKYTSAPVDINEQRKAFLSGVDISELQGARIWCVLATKSGVFLGFFIDGNHLLYLNDSITITHVDTSGDNNGAGYKGTEDTYSVISLVQNPDIQVIFESDTYTFRNDDIKDGVVAVPDGFVEIAPFAFRGCAAEHIIIPEGVRTISRHAFDSCRNLKSVSLPSSLTQIGVSAFAGCVALEEIVLPPAVELVDDNTFEGCISLKSAILPGVKRIGFCGFDACAQLSHIEIPVVEALDSFAFARNGSLSHIDLPDTLITISNAVFKECFSLKRIKIPASVKEFDENAFFYTDNLKEVLVSEDFYEEFVSLVRFNFFSNNKNFLKSVKITKY